MSNQQIRSLDMRLMRLGYTLLAEASVSRTAALLGQSQPAISLALRRLRAMTGDPLLVRSGAHLVLTDRGIEFRQVLCNVLGELDRAFDAEGAFDPARLERPLRLVVDNCFGALLMPRIIELVHAAAPDLPIDFLQMPQRGDVVERLESGDVDIVIGNWPRMPENLRFSPLAESEILCLVSAEHPIADQAAVTLDEYLTLSHLSPTPLRSAHFSPIDGRLAELGLKRKVTISVPEYNVVPQVLSGTNLVFTTCRPFAEQILKRGSFAIIGAPKELGTMQLYSLWHDRSHRSGSGRWLRRIVRQAARGLGGTLTDLAPRETAEAIP
jgi:DNA-binding transcriptional LysR family regulator